MAKRIASIELISRFHTEMERLFTEALELGADPATEWCPELDIVETAESILILVEVPGLAPEDIKIEVRGTRVAISGVKMTPLPADKIRFQRIERAHGRFRREVQLFVPVNSHMGRARLTDGLLAVEFPKVEEKRLAARPVPIEEASAPASRSDAEEGE
ncbi:MAG TPA: Hsp20/alpha crystallin family protein [Thermoanaerobaculia bacterium]|nr:Hsp20/alpha crystallin family protein [Thermoanaerobaculia bacterium]